MQNKQNTNTRYEHLVTALKQSIMNVRYNDPYTSIYLAKIQLDQYFGEHDYVQVKGLYDFVSKFDQTPSDTITEMIKANGQAFGFLNKLVVSNKDFIDEMREHGLGYACMVCRNTNLLAQKIANREQLIK